MGHKGDIFSGVSIIACNLRAVILLFLFKEWQCCKEYKDQLLIKSANADLKQGDMAFDFLKKPKFSNLWLLKSSLW